MCFANIQCLNIERTGTNLSFVGKAVNFFMSKWFILCVLHVIIKLFGKYFVYAVIEFNVKALSLKILKHFLLLQDVIFAINKNAFERFCT